MPYSANLYRAVYLQTNGFALNWPLTKDLRIGDFFTIRDGRIAVLGNIYEPYFQLDVADIFKIERFRHATPALSPYEKKGEEPWQTFRPQPSLWHFSQGCYDNYESNRFGKIHKQNQEAPDYNAYRLYFSQPGSFFFAAKNVVYSRMPHFSTIYKEVIRRLTSQLYNFNRIFLVTELATPDYMTTAVSNEFNAELVLSVEDYPGENLTEFFSGDHPFKVELSRGMEMVQLKRKMNTMAFRAKKLELTTEAKDRIINNLYDSADPHIDQYAIELIDNGMFQLFPKIEINPANATEFFQWTDMSLEDIEAISSMALPNYVNRRSIKQGSKGAASV